MCQKCHDKCLKDGKFERIAAKKLKVCKESNFKGDVIINGQFCLKNPVTISVPDLHSGADLFKPTIQEAIDYFKGRHAMNGTILLKQNHKYLEKSLHLDKFMASRTDSEIDGFSIQGDTRPISSATYLQDGVNIRHSSSEGMGDFGVPVTLVSGSNTVQVVLKLGDEIDFSVAGIVPGDKIKLRDNTKNWYLRNVVSVEGNTITYDGESVQVGGYASALVIVPNVEILVTELSTLRALAYVGNLSATFKGLWLNLDTKRGSADEFISIVTLDRGQLILDGCLLEKAGNGIYSVEIKNKGILIGNITDRISLFSSQRISTFLLSGFSSDVVFNYGIYTDTGGDIISGAWNFFDGIVGIHLGNASSSRLNYIQCVGQTGTSLVIESSNVRYYDFARFLQSRAGIFLLNSNFNVNFNVSGGSFIIDSNVTAIQIDGNSSASIDGGIIIKNCVTGIYNSTSSRTYFDRVSFYNNTLDVLTEEAAPISNGNLRGNVFVYNFDPGLSIRMENAYPKQEFKTCGKSTINLTLDPSESININLYEGKTFLLSSSDDLPHRLSLINGGKFVGLATGTAADFNSVGDFIQFTVLPVNDCGAPVYNVLLTSKSSGVTIV